MPYWMPLPIFAISLAGTAQIVRDLKRREKGLPPAWVPARLWPGLRRAAPTLLVFATAASWAGGEWTLPMMFA